MNRAVHPAARPPYHAHPIKSSKTVHVDWPPAYLLPRVLPSRFHFSDEPLADDGHRHEYGVRTLVCENARRCRRRAPIPMLRMDRQRLIENAVRRHFLTKDLEEAYGELEEEQWSPPPLP